MSRQYSSQPDLVEYHRRSTQPYETTNYAARGSPRNLPLTRTSPLNDNGSDKGDQQPRRRIGLACSRCRKRKIKCSGDIGGAGCQNCKNAGAEECNFLRVNSTSLLPASTAIDYPYSTPSLPASMSRGNSGMSSLYSGGYGMMQAPGAASYPARTGSINGQHYSLTSRHSHPSAAPSYNLTHLDGTFDNYTQAPQYLLPAQDPSMSYGTQDTSRHWTPIAGNRQSNSVGYESESSFKYGPSGFPYLNSSAISSIPENYGMNSLSLSRELPRHGDRILPTPRKMSYEPSSNSYQKSGESASYGLKSSIAWPPQTLTHGTSQGSVSSTSLSTFSGSLSSVSSSPPIESGQGATTFGYVPVSSSPLHRPLSAATEDQNTIPEIRLPKTRTILPQHSSYSLYNYSMGSGPRLDMGTEPGPSEATLVNGGRYVHIREKPINHNPCNPLPVEQPKPKTTAPAHTLQL